MTAACSVSRADFGASQVWHRRVPTRPSQTDPEQLESWQEIRHQVGLRIRKLRLDQGLTQEALALEAKISRNQLVEVEHGRRSLLYERLFDLALVLGVRPSELLELDDSADL